MRLFNLSYCQNVLISLGERKKITISMIKRWFAYTVIIITTTIIKYNVLKYYSKMEDLKCKLVKIIDPSQYLVLSQDNDHISEIKHLEKSLTKEIKLHDGKNKLNFVPEMDVIVQQREGDMFFKRGKLKDKLNDKSYNIFLCDYGEMIAVEKSRIFTTENHLFNAIEPLTFTLKLYGIIPIAAASTDQGSRQRICNKWSSESSGFVEKLLKKDTEIFVESVLIYEKGVYGDIFITQKGNDGSKKSLRKLLIECEYCVYSENYFLKTVFGIKSDAIELGNDEEEKRSTPERNDRNFCSEKNQADIVRTHSDASHRRKKVSYEAEKCERFGLSATERNILRADSNRKVTENSDAMRQVSIGRGKVLILPSNDRGFEDSGRGGFHCVTKHLPGTFLSSADGGWFSRQRKKTSKIRKSNAKKKGSTHSEMVFVADESRKKFSNTFFESFNETLRYEETENSSSSDGREDLDGCLFIKNPLLCVKPPPPPASTQMTDVSSTVGLPARVKLMGNSQDTGNLIKGKFGEPFVLFKDSESVEPAASFKDLIIASDIKQNMRDLRHFDDLNPVQRHSIPAILSGQNAVVIGSSNTGKTLSYIIHVINFIWKMLASELPRGNGPLAIILCSSSLVCDSIYRTCCYFLKDLVDTQRKRGKPRILVAYGSVRQDKLWVNLTNGCHILISTPHCLTRLLEMPLIINLERLACLVLDEFEILSEEPFRSKIYLILERSRLVAEKKNYQMIICGKRWTPEVENLINAHVVSYILIISSYLEAVIYARLKPNIYFADKNHKSEIVCDVIQKRIGEYKILVVCENANEVIDMSEYLKNKRLDSLMAHEHIEADNYKDILSLWNAFRPLVVTDAILHELKINDADVLVHYSVTRKSKTNFFFRYATILTRCFDRLSSSLGRNSRESPVDFIILDEENHHQLPQIIDCFTRLGGNVPEKLHQISEKIRREMEASKETGICHEILRFGHCGKKNFCFRRHAFLPSLDSPSEGQPREGWVSFSIVKVHDASKFSVKLLHHLSLEGIKSTIHHDNILDKVERFYGIKENRRIHPSPKIGGICAVKSNSLRSEWCTESFNRAQIVECTQRDEQNQGTEFMVRFIDSGDLAHVKRSEMYELSSDLAEIPPLVIDVILTGVRPLDFDANWSEDATAFMSHLLMGKLEKNENWLGKIVLALKNLLFLEPVVLRRFFPGLNSTGFEFILGEKILKRGFGVPNKKHLENLIKLCKEGNIELPPGGGLEEGKMKIIQQPSWVVFYKEKISAEVSIVQSFSSIFLRKRKSSDLVSTLEEICQIEAQKLLDSDDISMEKLEKLSPGSFCLAPFLNSWRRGIIESEMESAFEINFVDHGNVLFVKKDKVLPVFSPEVLELPCQAVECRLIGIRANDENDPELLNEMSNFLFEESDIGARIFGSECSRGEKRPKYIVDIFNSKGNSLSFYLLEKKMVKLFESEAMYLEGCVSQSRSDETEKLFSLETLSNVKNDLGKYFESISDDLFTKKNELLFLEEFASKVIKFEKKKEDDIGFEISKSLEKISNSHAPGLKYTRLANLHRNSTMKKDDRVFKLNVRKGILTPQVFWHQDRTNVRLKVGLSNVEKYRCDCTETNILFRCIADDKVYAFGVRFFGGINPETVVVKPKTFQVDFGLDKIGPFIWPRLQRDEDKLCWIHLDPDGLRREEEVSLSEPVEAAKRSIEAGTLKKGIRMENLLSYSESENELEELDDDDFKFSDTEF